MSPARLETIECIERNDASNSSIGSAAISLSAAVISQNLDKTVEQTITADLLLSRRVAADRGGSSESQESTEENQGLELHDGMD
ncbi:hypothetical protein FBU30_010248 [Linnemannia zychae]|nr:hypothetical protein FBU30_010248 [Linnemannia zychae]